MPSRAFANLGKVKVDGGEMHKKTLTAVSARD